MTEKRFHAATEAALHESLNKKVRTLNHLLSSVNEHLTGLAEARKVVQHTLSEMDELCSDMNTGVMFHEWDIINDRGYISPSASVSVPSEQFELAKGQIFGEFAEVLAYFCEQKHKEDVSALLGGVEMELLEDLHRQMSKEKTEASTYVVWKDGEISDVIRAVKCVEEDGDWVTFVSCEGGVEVRMTRYLNGETYHELTELEELRRRSSKQESSASSKKELEDILRLLDDPKSDKKELKRRLNNVLGRYDALLTSADLRLRIDVYDEQARFITDEAGGLWIETPCKTYQPAVKLTVENVQVQPRGVVFNGKPCAFRYNEEQRTLKILRD